MRNFFFFFRRVKGCPVSLHVSSILSKEYCSRLPKYFRTIDFNISRYVSFFPFFQWLKVSLERRINYNFEKLEIRNLIVQSVFKTALKKKKEGNLRKVTLRKNSCLFKISLENFPLPRLSSRINHILRIHSLFTILNICTNISPLLQHHVIDFDLRACIYDSVSSIAS